MKQTVRNLKKVYEYGKKFKFNLILEVIGSIFGIIVSIIIPIFAAHQLVNFTNAIWEEVIYISLILFGISIIHNLSIVLIRKNTQRFWGGTVKNIQLDLGKEILKIEQRCLDKTSSGVFMQRLSSDTENLASIFTVGMGYLVGLTSSAGIFIAIFIINKQVFLYYLIVSLILTLFYLIKVKKYGKRFSDFLNQSDNVSSLAGELIRGIKDIKMLNAKDSFLSNLQENIEIQNQKRMTMRNVEINYNFLIGILKGLFELLLVVLLVYLTDNGIISVAIAVVLFSYRTRVMDDLMEKLGSLLNEIKKFNISCNRVFSILGSNIYIKESFGIEKLSNVEGSFSFENVSFSYDNENNVLNDLTFKIKAGETVGFVGKSGAGKTTIFNLLIKLYTIQTGRITIENKNVNDLDENSIRENITIISQNPYIFNLSINNNLKLVKQDLTDDEIKEACKIACLDDFIETLPNKYDTVVGEGGITLSGGQKQRLAIARAFVQKTKIILFDEATSALDNETQAKIQQAINNLKSDYTILIIAHRLSTLMNCDKIMVLNNGKIDSIGTHKELLKISKTYKKLYENELIEESS